MRVEPLDPATHNRTDFECGRPELNDWLAKHSGQAQTKHHSARTFVLTEDGVSIIGFYSLTSHTVDIDAVSAQLARGQSRFFPIPAVLLARLAVRTEDQGKGLGERLLAHAVHQAVNASLSIGIALLVVDAVDDRAAAFYEKFGFARWPTDGLRLFARLSNIAASL